MTLEEFKRRGCAQHYLDSKYVSPTKEDLRDLLEITKLKKRQAALISNTYINEVNTPTTINFWLQGKRKINDSQWHKLLLYVGVLEYSRSYIEDKIRKVD